MTKISKYIVIVIFALSVGTNLMADVKLAKIFTDNMMIQRDKPIKVWGTATPGSKVKITFIGKEVEVTAADDGKFIGELPAIDKGEDLELTVTEKNTITIKNIIIGDIWFCSGQSNMEYKLGSMRTIAADEIDSADFPKIRFIVVVGPATPFPQSEIIGGPWAICTPKTAGSVTAVGFFFGREIHRKTQVPIGLIDCSWGGTAIEPWVPNEGLLAVPELKSSIEKIENDFKAYRASILKMADEAEKWAGLAREAVKSNTAIPASPVIAGPPGYNVRDYWSNIYNGRVLPLINFPIKGAIWYQGESNGGQGDVYYHKMMALIKGWREVWKIGEFPFYFVQLANFQDPNDNPAGGDGWSKTRSAQLDSLKIPNTGMAVIIDIGEAKDIHPRDKLNVGLRLSRWALARDYGEKDMVISGPLFKEMKIEGSTIKLSFDHIGSGLMIGKKTTIESKNWKEPAIEDKEAKLKRFAIAGDDKVWYWADAIIDGDTVIVSSPKVTAPVAVRYAFSHNPLGANLYNKEGLPASPFRTDNW